MVMGGARPMYRQRNFLLFVAVAMAAAVPALGSETRGAASIPDFSGVWNHPAFPWFEPPASGPGPITNLSRWAEQMTDGAGGSPGLPVSTTGISDYDQL